MKDDKEELQWNNLDLRYVELFHAISALRMYLDLMERQMPIIETSELAALESKRPLGNDEEEQSLYWNEVNYLVQLFEEDLVPTMRYSFVVFLHTVFETRLRGFCDGQERQRKLPISVTDLSGRDIDQAKTYLTRLVGVAVGSFDEWAQLRRFQDIRNCVVHYHGYLSPNKRSHEQIRQLAATSGEISISSDDRIHLSRAFCEQQVTNIESFFKRLIATTDSAKPTGNA